MASSQNGGPGDSSIKTTYRSGRSTPTFLLHKVLRPFRHLISKAGHTMPKESPRLTPSDKAQEMCSISERKVDGIWIYDMTAKAPTHSSVPEQKDGPPKRIYYYCGGGWRFPATAQHFYVCAALVNSIPNATLSVVSYPLAPEAPAPVSFPQIVKLYHTLLTESARAGETVILAGDSAGANIALCLPLYAVSQDPENAPVPAAVMAISSSMDLRRSNPEIREVANYDPMLTIEFIQSTAKEYRGEWDAFDPRISPLAADLKAIAARGVSIHGVTGSYDMLSPDGILFKKKCEEVGIKGEWLVWEKQMHDWVLTAQYGFPEAKETIQWIADVITRA